MAMFGRKRNAKTNITSTTNNRAPQIEMNDPYSNDDGVTPPHASSEKQRLPHHNNTQRKHGWIKEDGDAKRTGFHPFHFLHCCFRSSSRLSMLVNVLWPLVPAAIAVVSGHPPSLSDSSLYSLIYRVSSTDTTQNQSSSSRSTTSP